MRESRAQAHFSLAKGLTPSYAGVLSSAMWAFEIAVPIYLPPDMRILKLRPCTTEGDPNFCKCPSIRPSAEKPQANL